MEVRNGSELLVTAGRVVPADETIAYFDPFAEPIIAEVSGRVRFEDIVLGTTLKEEINEDTGKIEKKITEFPLESLQPRIIVVDAEENEAATYYLPGQALSQRRGRRRGGRRPRGGQAAEGERQDPRHHRRPCRAWVSCSRRAAPSHRRCSPRSAAW